MCEADHSDIISDWTEHTTRTSAINRVWLYMTFFINLLFLIYKAASLRFLKLLQTILDLPISKPSSKHAETPMTKTSSVTMTMTPIHTTESQTISLASSAMLRKIDKLRERGIGEHLYLPEVCVVDNVMTKPQADGTSLS